LAIETFAEPPGDRTAPPKGEKRDEFFRTIARDRYRDLGVRGIYVLICKSPGYVGVELGDATRKKAFTPSDRTELRKKMVAAFGEKKFDEGLIAGVNFVDQTLRANGATAKTITGGSAAAEPVGRDGGKGAKMSGIWGWICIGLVVLLGI